MPPYVLFLRAFLSLVVLGTFAGMLTAYFWFLRRVIVGRALLPPLPTPPRLVPWGVGTVVYVVLLWFSVNIILVAVAYSRLSRAPLPKTCAGFSRSARQRHSQRGQGRPFPQGSRVQAFQERSRRGLQDRRPR